MSTFECWSLLFIVLSFILSCVSLVLARRAGNAACRANKSAEDANDLAEDANGLAKGANELAKEANTLAEQANAISSNANNISMSAAETALRTLIEQTRDAYNNKVDNMSMLIAKEENGGLNDTEKRQLEILRQSFMTSVESWVNAYEEACGKYLDGKIDKERFRRHYRVEVRTLVESKEKHLQNFFSPPTTSRFKAILKVYDEWENLEK